MTECGFSLHILKSVPQQLFGVVGIDELIVRGAAR